MLDLLIRDGDILFLKRTRTDIEQASLSSASAINRVQATAATTLSSDVDVRHGYWHYSV
jgi:hypothetical protein